MHGKTPLMYAVLRRYSDAVEVLLKNQAVKDSVNIQDKDNMTALCHALKAKINERSRVRILHLLTESGADDSLCKAYKKK